VVFDMDGVIDLIGRNKYLLITLWLIIVNLAAFILCGIDKKAAILKLPRVRERTLILLSFFGGALFMLLGMCIFRHKTHKERFVILIPCFLILHLVCILILEAKSGFLSGIFF